MATQGPGSTDKTNTLSGLNDAVEALRSDNSKQNVSQSELLGNISENTNQIYALNHQMVELLSAIQQELAPDAFGAAQATEKTREAGAGGGDGPPIVGGPADKSSTGGMGWKSALIGGAIGGLIGLFAGFLDFDADKVKDKVVTLTSIGEEVSVIDTAETVATLTTLGAALAIFGAGSAIVGLGSALANFMDPNWADTIKQNVINLVSIADEVGLVDTAETVATLAALGVGLAFFGAGSAIAGLGSAIANFSDPAWAQNIVDNVVTLVGMNEQVSLVDAIKFPLKMAPIALGLAAFGVGSAVAGIGDAIANFSSPGWAQNIVDNVVTLVGINDSVSLIDAIKFPLKMAPIAAGIAIFGIGSAVAGIGDALANFASPGWAQNIVDNIVTLMQVTELPMTDVAEFPIIMGALGLGMAAFALGEGANAIAQFASSEDWAEKIKKNVVTLLSIVDAEGVDQSKANEFVLVMGKISAGLMAFSAGKLVDSLVGAGSAILNFITGNESPVEQMMKIADRADELNTGADALDRIRGALSGLGNLKFDGSDLGLEEFAEDLMKAVPTLESAIMGGVVKGGIWPWSDDDVEFKGLASSDIKYNQAIQNIAALREALGMGSSITAGSSAPQIGSRTDEMLATRGYYTAEDLDFDIAVAEAQEAGDTSTLEQLYAQAAELDAATGTSTVTPPSTNTFDSLSLPYDLEEQSTRAILLARAMGLSEISGWSTSGTVPTQINGINVPASLLTGEEIDNINAARMARASMNSVPGQEPIKANLIQKNEAQTANPTERSTAQYSVTGLAPTTSGGSLGTPADTQVLDTGNLTIPYNKKEMWARTKQIAKELGLNWRKLETADGRVPTRIDGVDVPTWLYTDEEIDAINAGRTMRADMASTPGNRVTPNLIPTRRSGEGLQQAQAEANANTSQSGAGANAIINNIAPNTVNNAATTNLATRTIHHKVDDNYLLVGAY